MFGLDAVLGGVSAVQGIVGAFGAARRAKAAQEYRIRLLNERKAQMDREFQDLRAGNLQALRRSTGVLGDALRQGGADLGSAMASAGVYNSSATAGAIQANAAQMQAQLADQQARNFQTEQGLLHSGQQDVWGREMGMADADYAQSLADKSAAMQSMIGGINAFGTGIRETAAAKSRQKYIDGLQSVLQKNTQNNLGTLGLSGAGRTTGPYVSGMQGGATTDPFGLNRYKNLTKKFPGIVGGIG